MKLKHKLVTGVLLGSLLIALALLGKRHWARRTTPGFYSAIAEKIQASSGSEWCDEHVAARRKFVAGVVDRFGPEIQDLWRTREQSGPTPAATLSLGIIQLRVNSLTQTKGPTQEFADSSWSWEEAYGLVQKTQFELNATERRSTWRNIHSITRFLLEKDFARTELGRKFPLPEKTEHSFRPNRAVRRSGRKEFRIVLHPGEFAGYESVLQKLLEKEWSGGGYQVRIDWDQMNPYAYRFAANLRSGRSLVNHERQLILLENLAWTKTVAHELGHVLGFADHYYQVWNARHCYYTEKARNADLMSNSELGLVLPRHWEILDQAYPWGKPAGAPFSYRFDR